MHDRSVPQHDFFQVAVCINSVNLKLSLQLMAQKNGPYYWCGATDIRHRSRAPLFFPGLPLQDWIMSSSRLVALCLVIALAVVRAEDAADSETAAEGCTFENILP